MLRASFPASPKRGTMTKAPFSVEWLSQSSQTLKSPTEGSPHRASSAGHGPGSGSSLGQSERSPERPAGPRDGDGTGGRSRESGAAAPAAGTAGQPGLPGGARRVWGTPGLPGKAPLRGGCSGRRGRRSPARCPGLADPSLLLFVPVPRSRREAVGSGAGGGSRVRGPRGAVRARRAAAADGVQRGADQHPGELLPAAAVPGRRRAPAAGGQDAPLRGAGERGRCGGAGPGNGHGTAPNNGIIKPWWRCN